MSATPQGAPVQGFLTVARGRVLAAPTALALLVAAGAALRFALLGSDSLWFDEGWSVRVARLDPVALVREAADADTHPPLYYLLLHAWMRLVGDSETAIRSLSALIGTITIPVVFALGAKLGGRRVALAAAAFAAVSPFWVEYGQEARMYTLVALLTTLSFLTFVRLRESATPGRTALYVLATTLLLYSHVYGLFVVLAQGTIALTWIARAGPATRRRAELRTWVLAFGAPLALYSPWLAVLVGQVREEFRGEGANLAFLDEPSLRNFVGTFVDYVGTKVGLVVAGLVAAAVVAVNVAPGRARLRALLRAAAAAAGGRHAPLLLTWVLAATLVPFVLSVAVKAFYDTRYTMPASVGFYLLLAFATAALPRRAWQVVAVVALAAVMIEGSISYHRGFTKDRWRELVAEIDARAQPSDFVLFDPAYNQSNVFDYYSSRADLLERAALPLPSSLGPQVWLVAATSGSSAAEGALRRLGYEKRSSSFYGGNAFDVQLLLFGRP